MDLDALKKRLEQGNFDRTNTEQNVKNMIDYFENRNEKEITVPEGHVYVMGDDWFRSSIIGPLSKEKIIGRVLGYR
jgi:signal peptidase I